jgi:hypothetical protein
MAKKTLRYSRPVLHGINRPGSLACVSGSAAAASGWSCTTGGTDLGSCRSGTGAVAKTLAPTWLGACDNGYSAVGPRRGCRVGTVAAASTTGCASGNTAKVQGGGNACAPGGNRA